MNGVLKLESHSMVFRRLITKSFHYNMYRTGTLASERKQEDGAILSTQIYTIPVGGT